jgi:polyisoprenoid-binding protein YceI
MSFSLLSAQLSQLVSASALAGSLALGAPVYVHADASLSTVSATIHRLDVPVAGRFTRFDAQIAFNPVHPNRAHARLSIDTASYDLGDRDANAQARGKNWFDSADYPHANFVSTSFVPAGGDRYSMTGRLTIRGRTQDVVVPVRVSHDGHNEVFDGSLPVKRLRFGVGQQASASEAAAIGDDVVIQFHLVVPARSTSPHDPAAQ